MFYGTKNNRYPTDERVIFERLWRGALCQAFASNRVPLSRLPPKRQCCCHCHCGGGINNSHIHNNNELLPNKPAMRSIVR